MAIAYIGLGSNMGDRVGYIQQAYQLLSFTQGIKVVDTSSLYETEPYGFKDQEWFVNAVVKIKTELKPYELLDECMRIEKQLGRVRKEGIERWGPRTMDADILLYDDTIIEDDDLQIPHSGLELRACFLVPLLEIAPDVEHPVLNKTMEELYDDLSAPEEVYLYGTRIRDV